MPGARPKGLPPGIFELCFGGVYAFTPLLGLPVLAFLALLSVVFLYGVEVIACGFEALDILTFPAALVADLGYDCDRCRVDVWLDFVFANEPVAAGFGDVICAFTLFDALETGFGPDF